MLDFYREHAISPVRQEIGDVQAHFARRACLYRSLGLPPMAIRGTRVLEIGPGTGENARYIASLLPNLYVLLEPNDTARQGLEATFPTGEVVIRSESLEAYRGAGAFDVVLCEGLLGLSGRDPGALLTAAGDAVKVGGVLVITCIDAISQCAEVLRRALAQRYLQKGASLQRNVELLTPVFAPHLATLKGMTRSVADWIVDNILNPASIGPTLSIPAALDAVEGRFAVLGCSPRGLLGDDWRWYKESAPSNQWAIESYWKTCHNLYDKRMVLPDREPEKNRDLMRACSETRADVALLEEGHRVWVNTRDVETDPGWFGRGQQYLSLERIA